MASRASGSVSLASRPIRTLVGTLLSGTSCWPGWGAPCACCAPAGAVMPSTTTAASSAVGTALINQVLVDLVGSTQHPLPPDMVANDSGGRGGGGIHGRHGVAPALVTMNSLNKYAD